MENDKINGKWVTLKNGRHVLIKEGQTLAGALKESDRQKTEDLKRIYDSDFSGTNIRCVKLEKGEYRSVCSAINTNFPNRKPGRYVFYFGNFVYTYYHKEFNEYIFISRTNINNEEQND